MNSLTNKKKPTFDKNTLNHTPKQKKARKVRILLVEDDASTLLYMKHMLKILDTHVTCADTGSKAFKLIEKSFDLILLDIGLPDCNGLQIAQLRRCHEYYNKKPSTPIIVLTAMHIPYLLEDCNDLNIQAVQSKTFKMAELKTLIHLWISQQNYL